MQDNQQQGGNTESGEEQNQASDSRVFTQDEMNEIISERIAKERRRVEQRYKNVDVERYQRLVEAEEQGRMQAAQTRAEFEQILQDTVQRKETVIQQLQRELHNTKIDGRLMDLAGRNRAVNPSQVVKLLKDQVRLTELGEVEVLDSATGKTRYDDQGRAMNLETFVAEWLQANPHFQAATSPGSGTASQRGGQGAHSVDVARLDMSRAEDRKLYREYRQQRQN